MRTQPFEKLLVQLNEGKASCRLAMIISEKTSPASLSPKAFQSYYRGW